MAKPTFPIVDAEEAASWIEPNARIGFSGFTPAGSAKAVPTALAQRAAKAFEAGQPMQLSVLTGASTGPEIDRALASAHAIRWRSPYQHDTVLREEINSGRTEFVDLHLSHVPQMLEAGFFDPLDWCVVEATDVTPGGRIYLTTSIGIAPSMLRHSKGIIVERNRFPSPRLWEMQDIVVLRPPPHRHGLQIDEPLDRIGVPFVQVDPKKIRGIVETDLPDAVKPYRPVEPVHQRIAEHIADFLHQEMQHGRVPPSFLPLQAGVGNISNAIMETLGDHPEIPPFTMFTEVFQDSLLELVERGKIIGASASALTLSSERMQYLFDNMDEFSPRLVLRPQEISNHPALVRRLGVIAINTVIEFDIYGHANSTHVLGSRVLNGIGGSGDFVRNAYLSILVATSTAKDGDISTIVPMVSHVDHTEHSVQVVVTEHGLADLRGLAPVPRARRIIDTCADPIYRPYLHDYLEASGPAHIPHDLGRAFELHRRLQETGTMRPTS